VRKKFIATILLGLLFFGFFVKAGVQSGVIIRLQNSTGAHVFVKALYPDGFKSLGVYTVGENGRILVKLDKLEKAWNTEYRKHGRLSKTLLILTIIKDGKIAIESLNLNNHSQTATIKPEFKPLKITSQNSKNIQPKAGYYQWLDDSYTWTAPTIVAQVTPDSTTYYDISYTYLRNHNVGFSINVFADSDWTRLTSYNWVQKNRAGKANASTDTGQDYYIWMDFTYRWERWGIHIDGQTFYEDYVYIADFDPSTLTGGTSKPSNAQTPPVDKWIYEGNYQSSGYPAYYQFHLYNLGTNEFSIDALKFIEVLKRLGKISSAAAEKASLIGLFLSVNFKYESNNAFDFDLFLHSPPGISHDVWRTKSTDMDTVPILYFDVD